VFSGSDGYYELSVSISLVVNIIEESNDTWPTITANIYNCNE